MARKAEQQPAPVVRSAAEVRKVSYLLAGVTGLDHRTCRRAVEHGTRGMTLATAVLIEDAAERLNIALPGARS